MFNKLVRQVLTGVAAVAIGLSLSACAGNTPGIDPRLEAGVEYASANVKLEDLPGREELSDFKVRAEAPNTLVYEYFYKESVDIEEAKAHLERYGITSLTDVATDIKKSFENEGIEDPKIKYRYLDHTGKVVWEHTF
ncbi:DUF4854 domain-containing protein [Gleimia sp. 6138-11-ORH1]|uniref:DUF4854 domain-containing protein n=1 Tax=Gleimia sp. 6138-11-ORH1 TaxID=2973937 RepID=UPI0021687294|nr:DUF4854 domain-containing protein [Gleimia sp. 6138-11-ORH1]MCS4484113.1 DUF4854 domain-containing protein [Gleimia sp. 6138-11-ORH1]